MRDRCGPAFILATLLLASCSGPVQNDTPSMVQPTSTVPPATKRPTPITPSVLATETPTPPTPTASAARAVAIDDLPRKVDLDPVLTTVVCDLGQAGGLRADIPLVCGDEAVIATRFLASKGETPARIYLERTPCAAASCTQDELSTGTVSVTSSGAEYEIAVDSRADTIIPVEVADPRWPKAAPYAPSGKPAPTFPGAPKGLVDRVPYPYCGLTQPAAAGPVNNCFRNSVLTGRPAEILQVAPQDRETWLYRYSGSGAVIAYVKTPQGWGRLPGSLIVDTRPTLWYFNPWGTIVAPV
jgi:hypothetical protein